MKETSLELTVTINADEATLRDTQNLLSGTTSRRPLTEVLAVMIEQTLTAAGITNEVEVNLQHSHLTVQREGEGRLRIREWEGGLSAREWMEAEEISHHPTSGQEAQQEDYQD